MLNIVIKMFATVGFVCTYYWFTMAWDETKTGFDDWRKKKCRIKCLCKHEYTMRMRTIADREVTIRCHKCGKRKSIRLDKPTFEKFFINRIENKTTKELRND